MGVTRSATAIAYGVDAPVGCPPLRIHLDTVLVVANLGRSKLKRIDIRSTADGDKQVRSLERIPIGQRDRNAVFAVPDVLCLGADDESNALGFKLAHNE